MNIKKLYTGYLAVLVSSIFMSLVIVPAMASDHGGGGGGGGGSEKREKLDANPEEKNKPSGFGKLMTGSNVYPLMDPLIKAKILKLVKTNQLMRSDLMKHGSKNWDSHASDSTKKSWEDNSPSAYAVLMQSTSGVVQSNPAYVGNPHPAAASLSDAVANAAWSMATMASKSKGNNSMVGFSTKSGNASLIKSSKNAVRMKNLAP